MISFDPFMLTPSTNGNLFWMAFKITFVYKMRSNDFAK